MNHSHKDIIGSLIRSNLPVLISQSFLLVFFTWQISQCQPIAPLVGIRQQSEKIQRYLIFMLLTESTFYFAIYTVTFVFSGINPFIDGSAMIGSLILLLRFLLIAILAIMIAAAYQHRHVGAILTLALLGNFAYHYLLEMKVLLIMYSPIYDPVYRAIHHLYEG
ncbi:hypothetical protein [Lacticaseibacillus zeae]|nr:hypothetical protein [Lacticaseibacillus zeae]MDE3316709.1 hypothetical protein [Lacticaseibacillus zeae]